MRSLAVSVGEELMLQTGWRGVGSPEAQAGLNGSEATYQGPRVTEGDRGINHNRTTGGSSRNVY